MAHAPAASPVALAETIATLQADLARNRAAGVQAKHARYRAKKEAASGGFSPLACKAIVAVYVLSDCYMELALRFAALWPAVKPTSGTTRVVVEDFFEHHRLRLAAHFYTFRDSVGTASAAYSRFSGRG